MENNAAKNARRIIIGCLLFLLIVILSVGGYYFFNRNKAITLFFPDLDHVNYVNTIIKKDSAFTKISMVFQNKNPYKLNIDTVDFTVTLADTLIAHQTIPLNIRLTRFEEDTVKVPLNLNIKKIRELIKSLQIADSTEIQTEGFIVYQTIFGKTKLRFDKRTKIEVPVPPQIKVLKVERDHFDFKSKTLKATAIIEIINKGKNLDLRLANVHYELKVKNTLQSKGTIEKPVIIKPGSSIIIKVPMIIEVFHPLKTVWLIKTDNDRLDYSLLIKCNLEENISKKSFTSPAEIFATGKLELVK